MSKSWSEVKSVLDDPYVDADTKEHLFASYMRESGYVYNNGYGAGANPMYMDKDRLPKDMQGYYDKYKLDQGDFYEGSVDDLYDDAKSESSEKGYQNKINDKKVDTGANDLRDMQAPTEGSTTGVQTSDEIFEKARPALKLWEDFLPVNDKVPSDQLGQYGKINLENDIKKRFEEQVGISFKNLLADAKRLRDAHGTLDTLNGDVEAELNKTYKDWTGPAANASYQYWSTKMVPNIKDLLDYLDTSPDTIDTAVANIFAACKDKANDVITLYKNCNGTVGSATPDIAAKVVKLAAGDFDSQDQVLEVAAWVDAKTGSNLESTIRADDCDLNDGNKEYVIRECKKWIRESFNVDLHDTMYTTYKKSCDDAFESVESYYKTMNEALAKYENKFGGALAAPTADSGGNNGNGNGSGNGNGGGGSGGGGTGGGGSGGGGTGGGGTPDVSTPPPTDPGDDKTDPSDADKPDDTNTPPSSTPGTDDQQETVTVKDGDREISVTSPDGEGQVKVTVDDGSGKPKTYTMDFGGQDPATGATPGQSGQPGQPGQPGTPGQGADGQGGTGADGQAAPGVPGQDAPIEPGPDGKCTVTDGDLTITAERPEGQPDTVVVTVDDGTGNPTTYNLDYSEAQTSGQAGGDPSGGQGNDPSGQGGQGHDPGGQGSPPGHPEQGPVTTLPYQVSGDLSAEPAIAYGEMPGGDQVSTMPAYGEMPPDAVPVDAQGVSTQPTYGEVPASLQGDQVSTQPAFGDQPGQSHDYATTAAAADPGGGGGHSSGGAAGSYGAPDHQMSPYMDRPNGEAGLASAPDNPADPSGHHGQQQPTGMGGGGMPMMGGGAPGGGGGSADSERAATQWRTTGDLFDEPADPQRLRGAFGGER